jgi:hypothetical protein
VTTQPGERAAGRLLAVYPRAWRARYGDEFTELLVAEYAERPRNWRRTANVLGSGLLARLTSIGLTSHGFDPADQARASLATLGCALAVFGTFGLAMLAQLGVGWQWALPRDPVTTAGLALMAGAAAVLAATLLLAAGPVAWQVARALLAGPSARGLGWRLLLVVTSAVTLVAGAHRFQNAWPGTGGTAAYRGLMPAGPAAFGWASTLSVSSYWAHPKVLQAFPWPELAWMVLSPAALLTLAGATASLLRRQRMPARLLAFEARLALAAALAMACFLAGAACWVFGQGAAAGLFHAGAVDVAGLAVMTIAVLAAARAADSARRCAAACLARA